MKYYTQFITLIFFTFKLSKIIKLKQAIEFGGKQNQKQQEI